MTPDTFIELVEQLTGTPPKGISDNDRVNLADALANDERTIDVSLLNELLLLANKDRVTPAFFKYFFAAGGKESKDCRVAGIGVGVERFRKMAMLCFGNFIYAYRQLSRLPDEEAIRAVFGRDGQDPAILKDRFKARAAALMSVRAISRDETYMVGYLSAAEVVADKKRAQSIKQAVSECPDDWAALETRAGEPYQDVVEAAMVRHTARAVRARSGKADRPADLIGAIDQGLEQIAQVERRVEEVRAIATRNTDVYLTWDHMDIYFATSMRKKWEYEDLHDFVNSLMKRKDFQGLNVRYFDPTQSYDAGRISKGLVESLMLKRAVCTVYSVQDTDTLGKDSELAATLAQGKPVIAYAPKIKVAERAKQLVRQRPLVLKERLEFVRNQYETFRLSFAEHLDLLAGVETKIDDFEGRMPWRAVADQDEAEAFRKANHADLERFCTVLAEAEGRIYDKRAKTLQSAHPLGIQVNLATGVANGVLVARDIDTCAKLVYRILTNQLEFRICDDTESDCWVLEETLTGSVFRVVSRNQKLTNCFWNFYRHDHQPRA